MRLQSARAIGYYLDELHELGAELSLASNLASMSRGACRARRHVRRFRRRPARGALPARHHRHVFAPRQDRARTRPCGRAAAAGRRPGALRLGRRVQRRSCDRSRSRSSKPTPASWRAGVSAPCSAPSTCSASISRRSICRQNSDVHERTVAELFAAVSPGLDYKTLSEDGARRAPAPRTHLAPPAVLALHRLRRGDGRRTRALSRRRRHPEQIWPRRDPHLHHLQDRQRLRHAGACADPEGGGPRQRGRIDRRSRSRRCSRRSRICAIASA